MSRKCCCCIPVVVGAAILGLTALLFCAAELAVLIPYLAEFDIETFNPIQQNLNDIYYVFEDLLKNCVTEASCPFNMTTEYKQTIMTEVKSYESTVLMGAAVESGVYGLTALLLVIGIACKVGLHSQGLFTSVTGLCHPGISFVILNRSHHFKKSQNLISRPANKAT